MEELQFIIWESKIHISIKYIFIYRKQNSFKTNCEKTQNTQLGTHLWHEAKLKI